MVASLHMLAADCSHVHRRVGHARMGPCNADHSLGGGDLVGSLDGHSDRCLCARRRAHLVRWPKGERTLFTVDGSRPQKPMVKVVRLRQPRAEVAAQNGVTAVIPKLLDVTDPLAANRHGQWLRRSG